MDKRNVIKTGDVLLFSGNSPTGFLLRTFVSSRWNHVGIGFRFKDGKVSLNEEGDLFIFETNSGTRMDMLTKEKVKGAAFTHPDITFGNANRCHVRKLKEEFRTEKFLSKALQFTENNRGKKFPSASTPFLSAWLGINLGEENEDEMFCSQLVAEFFKFCFSDIYKELTGENIEHFSDIFGPHIPKDALTITPGHFSVQETKKIMLLEDEEEEVYICYADYLFIIIQPFIIGLVMVIIIHYLLKPRQKHIS